MYEKNSDSSYGSVPVYVLPVGLVLRISGHQAGDELRWIDDGNLASAIALDENVSEYFHRHSCVEEQGLCRIEV